MNYKEALSIGLISSGGEETAQLETLLGEHHVQIAHHLSPSDITTDIISEQNLHVWLLDIDDENWNDALDDLLDQSSVPVFFNERGSLTKQTHPEFWVKKLIHRLYNMAGLELEDDDDSSDTVSEEIPKTNQETEDAIRRLESATEELSSALLDISDKSEIEEPLNELVEELSELQSEELLEESLSEKESISSLESDELLEANLDEFEAGLDDFLADDHQDFQQPLEQSKLTDFNESLAGEFESGELTSDANLTFTMDEIDTPEVEVAVHDESDSLTTEELIPETEDIDEEITFSLPAEPNLEFDFSDDQVDVGEPSENVLVSDVDDRETISDAEEEVFSFDIDKEDSLEAGFEGELSEPKERYLGEDLENIELEPTTEEELSSPKSSPRLDDDLELPDGALDLQDDRPPVPEMDLDFSAIDDPAGSFADSDPDEEDVDIDIPLLDDAAVDMQFVEAESKFEPEVPQQNLWILGASLGGPAAVKRFLQALPPQLDAAFVLAQHIDESFLPVLCNILDTQTAYRATIVDHEVEIESGHVYIAPIKSQLSFSLDGFISTTGTTWTPPYSPCIDDVIKAAGGVYRQNCGAIIFSGMGDDGRSGVEAVKHKNVKVWAQSPETSANSSMPDAVIERQLTEYVGSPEELALQLAEVLQARPTEHARQERVGE